MSLLAIIPARGGSKRLKAKNVRNLNGVPMLAYTIQAAQESGIFDEIIVSTDDEEIMEVGREYGAKVPFKRPDALASDEAQITEVVEHAIKYYESDGRKFDNVCVLPPTSPLRSHKDIVSAYDKFSSKNVDFLISVTDFRYHPTKAFTINNNGNFESFWVENKNFQSKVGKEDLFKRSQDYPDIYADCVSIYIVSTDEFLSQMTFYGGDNVAYYIPPKRAVDIDDRFDFRIAELLIEERERNKGSYGIFEDRI